MKKKWLIGLLAGFLMLGVAGSANALLVEQYDDYWSTNVNNLMNYADTHSASTSAEWDIIDFTDDPMGFAGAIPGSNPWPSAAAAGVSGTGHPLNQTFFAKISGDFYVTAEDTYTFQTYNDDGIFLFVDGSLIINDPTQHPENRYQGAQYLLEGNHEIELYFFENGGEASLEFTLADSSGVFTHFDAPQYQQPVPEPATMLLLGLGIIGIAGVSRKKCLNSSSSST